MDRQMTFEGASVTVGAETPQGIWTLPLVDQGAGAYSAITNLWSIARSMDAEAIPSSSWAVILDANGRGRAAHDTIYVETKIPDLSVSAVSADTTRENYDLTCLVANIGCSASDFCYVRFFRDAPDTIDGEQIGDTVYLWPLEEGEERVLSCAWEVEELPAVVFAVVDPENVVLEEALENNTGSWVNPMSVVGSDIGGETPEGLRIDFASSNPATGELVVHYYAPGSDPVSIKLYDVAGRLIRQVHPESFGAGWHSEAIDLLKTNETPVVGGICFVRIQNSSAADAKKVLILR